MNCNSPNNDTMNRNAQKTARGPRRSHTKPYSFLLSGSSGSVSPKYADYRVVSNTVFKWPEVWT